MEVLQLQIPPMPQLLTVGHGAWDIGRKHLERNFPVYDFIVVKTGTLYMMEDDIPYTIKSGECLLLEPGRTHYGHMACTEWTEVYWLHFHHDLPTRRLDASAVVWSEVVKESTDYDIAPPDQYVYLPKYGPYAGKPMLKILDEMVAMHRKRTMEVTIDLQIKFASLLGQLQSTIRTNRDKSRAAVIAEQVKAYLEENRLANYDAEQLSQVLHINRDYAARCMRMYTGLSPLQYLQYIRMEEAKRLLKMSSITLNEVSEQSGYSDYNYFIRMFRKIVGISPGQYRRISAGLS